MNAHKKRYYQRERVGRRRLYIYKKKKGVALQVRSLAIHRSQERSLKRGEQRRGQTRVREELLAPAFSRACRWKLNSIRSGTVAASKSGSIHIYI